jgi:hypothetical protein
MDATTARFFHIDPTALGLAWTDDPDATATFSVGDEQPTEQMAAFSVEQGLIERGTEQATVEQAIFDEPLPLPPPSHGDPAYFVEVRRPRGTPSLLAVRTTLDEAVDVAASVHPGIADVIIRELALPCDAESLLHAATGARTWSREPNGRWVPAPSVAEGDASDGG